MKWLWQGGMQNVLELTWHGCCKVCNIQSIVEVTGNGSDNVASRTTLIGTTFPWQLRFVRKLPVRGGKRSYPRVSCAPASTLSRSKCDPTWSRGKCDPRAPLKHPKALRAEPATFLSLERPAFCNEQLSLFGWGNNNSGPCLCGIRGSIAESGAVWNMDTRCL